MFRHTVIQRRCPGTRRLALAVLSTLAVGAPGAAFGAGLGAQEWEPDRGEYRHAGPDGLHPLPRLYLELAFLGANPVGEFGQLVQRGFGGQAGLRTRLGERSPVLLRLDGGVMIYGHERSSVCFAAPIGCRVGADLTTTNAVAYMGVGPEIAGQGEVSPYVFGTFGFSYFATTSSLSGFDDFEGLFRTRNHADLVGALRAGGGLRVQLGGPGTASLDLGAEYHRNGVARYLREGDILDHPDGSITLFPNQTEANFMSFRLGLSIPVGYRSREGGPR
ncbi:MAG: hypothetical protein RQ751_05365 [Longimicrobiales bacterium]|nr:hypothetical protein [Longimicrobiales bacterium]